MCGLTTHYCCLVWPCASISTGSRETAKKQVHKTRMTSLMYVFSTAEQVQCWPGCISVFHIWCDMIWLFTQGVLHILRVTILFQRQRKKMRQLHPGWKREERQVQEEGSRSRCTELRSPCIRAFWLLGNYLRNLRTKTETLTRGSLKQRRKRFAVYSVAEVQPRCHPQDWLGQRLQIWHSIIFPLKKKM